MNAPDESARPGLAPTDAAAPLERVAVWDLPVRIVHWAIVALLVALIATGKLGGEWLDWHMRFGQALVALLLFRVVWGFAGSRNARFRAFVHGPRAAFRYARAFVQRRYVAHATHNPLGGWMVLALLVALLVQAGTGMFANDDVLREGPLAARVTKDTSDLYGWFHRRFWWVVVGLSAVHVAGVLTYLAVHRENLTAAMITGRKLLPAGLGRPEDASASSVRAAILLLACGFAVWYLLDRLSG